MLSQSMITENNDVDVLFVGNLGAVAAEMFSTKTMSRFKIVVTHLHPTCKQQSLLPVHSALIKIKHKPKNVQVIRNRIIKIHPSSKIVVFEGGSKMKYKFLIYGQNQWLTITKQSPFYEALNTRYSFVYSNLGGRSDEMAEVQHGNIVFFVEKGRGSFRQNYPFLYYYSKLSLRKARKLQFIIILQGSSFFPHCQYANRLIEQQLRSHKFKIIYNTKVEKVDYLRRLLHTAGQETEVINYSAVYCLFSERVPEILVQSQIDPFANSPKYLFNQHESIYIFGADIFPTTHSLPAINHQLDVIVSNLSSKLTAIYSKAKHFRTYIYKGDTSVRIFLSATEVITIHHNYRLEEYDLRRRGCDCLSMLYIDYLEPLLTSKFYNFSALSLPHYFYSEPLHEQESSVSNFELISQIKCEGKDLC